MEKQGMSEAAFERAQELVADFVELVFQCARYERTSTDWKAAGDKLIADLATSAAAPGQDNHGVHERFVAAPEQAADVTITGPGEYQIKTCQCGLRSSAPRCPRCGNPQSIDDQRAAAPAGLVPTYEFEVWQNDEMQASGSAGTLEDMRREVAHYVSQYGQDGPIEAREFVRYRLAPHPQQSSNRRADFERVISSPLMLEKAPNGTYRREYTAAAWRFWCLALNADPET